MDLVLSKSKLIPTFISISLVSVTDRIPFRLRRMTDGTEHPFASFPDMILMLHTGHLVTDGSLYPTVRYQRTHHFVAISGPYIVFAIQRGWGSKIPSDVIVLDWKRGMVIKVGSYNILSDACLTSN